MLDISSFLPALKTYFSDDQVEEETYKDNAWLAMIPKFTKWTGTPFAEALLYEDVQGSATFANAQANGGTVQTAQFQLTEVEDYVVPQIANRVIKAAGDDRGSFLRATTTTVKSALRANAKSLGGALFLDGTGNIGQITAAPSSNTVTLIDITQIVNFAVGQTLDVNNAGTLRSGVAVVTSVNRAAGTITCSGGWPSGTTTNDYLVRDGDFNGKVTGLRGWIPLPGDNSQTAPNRVASTDSFFQVNRSKDVTRLAGWYFDGRGIPIPEAFTGAAELLDREGATPDVIYINPTNRGLIKNQLGSKVAYDMAEAFENPQISFRAIMFEGPKSDMKIIADRQCPIGYAYMLQLDTWTLRSRGKAPSLITYDMEGLEALRISNQDGIEIRVGYYAQVGCSAPGYNGVIQLQ